MPKSNFKVSVNEMVKVKLTDFGVDVLRQRHNELVEFIRERTGNDIGPLTLKLDDEGYYKTQLWHLMWEFGEYIKPGHKAPFELDIIMTNGEEIVKREKELDYLDTL